MRKPSHREITLVLGLLLILLVGFLGLHRYRSERQAEQGRIKTEQQQKVECKSNSKTAAKEQDLNTCMFVGCNGYF